MRLLSVLSLLAVLTVPSLVVPSVAVAAQPKEAQPHQTEPSEAQIIAAKAMMKAMSYDQVYDDTINSAFGAMSADMVNAVANSSPEYQRYHHHNPGAIAQALAPLDDILRTVMAEHRSEFEHEIVRIYARIFTVDEMNAATAFYRTALGQSVVLKTPKLVEETMVISQRIIGPRIMDVIQKNLPVIQKDLADKVAAAEKGQ